MTYFLLFNGPPRSGKSAMAREALRHYTLKRISCAFESFAAPMKQFMSALLGQPYTSIAKDDEHPLLDETPRTFLINLSEDYIKRSYGHEFFGSGLLYRADNIRRNTVLVLDDTGFEGEFSILPRPSVCLVRVMRPGFDFMGDSRDYLPKPNLTIVNDGNLERALSLTRDVVDYTINTWRLKPEPWP